MAAPTLFSLSCPSCGAHLKVGDSVDTFACSYCGANVKVEHGGGIVSLHLLTDEVRGVRVGTDRTAAELAIVRLTKELATLEDEAEELGRMIKSPAKIDRDEILGKENLRLPIELRVFGAMVLALICLLIYIGWRPLMWVAGGISVIVAIWIFAKMADDSEKLREIREGRECAEAANRKYQPLLDAKNAQIAAVKMRLEAQRAIIDKVA